MNSILKYSLPSDVVKSLEEMNFSSLMNTSFCKQESKCEECLSYYSCNKQYLVVILLELVKLNSIEERIDALTEVLASPLMHP